jgi:hypothetical protein
VADFSGFTVVAELDAQRVPVTKSRARKARPPSETSVKDAVMSKIRLAKGYCIAKHMTGAGKRGTPDVLACVQGRMVVVECKTGDYEPTPAQLGELRRWQDAGALAGYVRTVAELEQLLSHLQEPGWRNDFEHPGDGRSKGDPW